MVIKSILEKANISIVLISLLVLSITCSEVPNDSFENPNDPLFEGYKLDPVNNLRARFVGKIETAETIELTWNIPQNRIGGVSGFNVYRSLSDSSKFELFRTVNYEDARFFKITHPTITDVYNYLYKVSPFFVNESDTLIVDSPLYSILEVNPSIFATAAVFPFKNSPFIEFTFVNIQPTFYNESTVTIYFKNNENDFEQFASFALSENQAPIPVDVDLYIPEFYYKLNNNSYSSILKPISEILIDEYAEFTTSIDSTLSDKIYITFAAISEIFDDESDSTHHKLIASDTRTKTIILTENSKTLSNVVVSETSDFSEPFIYPNANADSEYRMHGNIQNGIYTSDEFFIYLYHDFKKSDEINGNFDFDGRSQVETSFHPTQPFVFLASASTNSTPVLLNYETGNSFEVPIQNDRYRINGKFEYNPETQQYELITAGKDASMQRWKINSNSVQKLNDYQSNQENYKIIDFDASDSEQYYILSHNFTANIASIASFIPDEGLYPDAKTINCISSNSVKVFHSPSFEKVYVSFYNTCTNLYNLRVYEEANLEFIEEFSLEISDAFFNTEYGEDQHKIVIYDSEYVFFIDLENLEVEYGLQLARSDSFKAVNINKSGREACYSILDERNSSRINCVTGTNFFAARNYYSINSSRELVFSSLNETGDKLLVLYNDGYQLINFADTWGGFRLY